MQADLEAMLSANAALLDGGVSLQRCLAGIGHLMSRPQLMRCLQQDPAFLYQASCNAVIWRSLAAKARPQRGFRTESLLSRIVWHIGHAQGQRS